jgi:hypothetical protein
LVNPNHTTAMIKPYSLVLAKVQSFNNSCYPILKDNHSPLFLNRRLINHQAVKPRNDLPLLVKNLLQISKALLIVLLRLNLLKISILKQKKPKKYNVNKRNLWIYTSYGQVKNQGRSAKANGLTTQCDRTEKVETRTHSKKNGADTEKPNE